MSSSTEHGNLVWADCEMTGLNPDEDHLIEIAVIITNSELEVLDELGPIVIHQPKHVMDGMNEWCVNTHGKSGLTKAVLDSKIELADAEETVCEFIKKYTLKGKSPLAGNSIGQDAKFLCKYMPKVMDQLSYRVIDVTTIKELSKRWYPREYGDVPAKSFSHRALDDILESIEELKYYRTAVFKPVPSTEDAEDVPNKKAKNV